MKNHKFIKSKDFPVCRVCQYRENNPIHTESTKQLDVARTISGILVELGVVFEGDLASKEDWKKAIERIKNSTPPQIDKTTWEMRFDECFGEWKNNNQGWLSKEMAGTVKNFIRVKLKEERAKPEQMIPYYAGKIEGK